MIPAHLLHQDGMNPSDDELPELTPAEQQKAIVSEKRRRASALGCAADEISLTDEAKTKTLYLARVRKSSSLRSAEYWKKVDQPQQLLSYTPKQMLDRFLATASHLAGREFLLDENNETIIKGLCCYFTGNTHAAAYGLDLSKGILLLGGVGCGKTTIMKAFSANFGQIDHPLPF
jgi:hypothetical protein